MSKAVLFWHQNCLPMFGIHSVYGGIACYKYSCATRSVQIRIMLKLVPGVYTPTKYWSVGYIDENRLLVATSV